MKKHITRFRLVAVLLVLVVSVLGWYWQTRSAQSPHHESTYLGLPTSHWHDLLNQPTVSHFWPPHEFPLRQHPHRDALPVLEELFADPDPHIREAAVCCLGFQPSPDDPVLPLLIRAVNDPHPPVRIVAMRALSRHGRVARGAAPAVLPVLSEDNEDLRFQAARTYFDITGQADAVLPALIRNLGGDIDEICQIDSAFLLGEIGPPAAPAVDALLQRLEDPSAPPESEGPFGIRFNNSEDHRRNLIHNAALVNLGNIGPSAAAALPAIRSAIRTRGGFVRASACVAYWKITGEVGPVVESMVETLGTGDANDKRCSATGLGRMGSAAEAAIPALVRALHDADHGVRWDAVVALGCIGPKAREAIPTLIELLKTDERIREDIVKALQAIDAKAAAEAGVRP